MQPRIMIRLHFTIEKGEGHVMRTLAGERSARLFKEIEESREGCSKTGKISR